MVKRVIHKSVEAPKASEAPEAPASSTTPPEIPKEKKTRKSHMKELTEKQLDWLKKKYYDDKFLFGRDRIFHLSQNEETGLSRRQIMKWLNLQEVHQKFLKTKRTKHIKATVLSEPHKQIGIDLIDMSDMSFDGFHWILTAIDLFSKKAFAVAVKTKTAKNVADGLKQILTMYGSKLSSIRSDNGSEFKAEVSKLLKDRGIKQVFSLPYLPQSNGEVERFNGTIKKLIKMSMSIDNSKNWVQYIDKATENYNNSLQKTTNHIPNKVDAENSAKVKENIVKYADRNKKEVNLIYKINDNVRVKEENSKTGVNWSNDVYKITKVFKPKQGSYAVPQYQIDDGNNTKYYNEDLQKVNEVEHKNATDEYFSVSKILQAEIHEGKPAYLVRFTGYRTPEYVFRDILIEDVPKDIKKFDKENHVTFTFDKKKKKWSLSTPF